MGERSGEIVEVEDRDSWDRFVRTAIGGTVFSTNSWLSCAEAAGDGRGRLYGLYRKDELVAGVSGVETRRAGVRRLVTPKLSPHGGFLFRPVASANPARRDAEQGGAARELLGFLMSEFGDVRLTHAPAVTDVREFSWAGWDVNPRYTYSIPIEPREKLWDRLERRTRAVIRKAEGELRFAATEDSSLLRRQYDLLYERSGEVPVDADFVERFVRHAAKRGLTESYVVEDSASGIVASIVVFVRGFDTIYAWVAGADPAYRDSGATSLLYWKLLQQSPFSRFDFVGANMREIALFKRGFGGTLLPYSAVSWCGSPLLRTLRLLRQWTKQT